MKKAPGLFESEDYKSYLRTLVGGPQQKTGVKSAMARALGCKPTYISHVLGGDANFSLEQAEIVNKYFGHVKEEAEFFLLMVLRDRAGTHTLKRHFQSQMDQILSGRLVLTKRLGEKNPLSEAERSVFYSVWHYLAVQIGVTLPRLRNPETLAKKLGLPLGRVLEVFRFLGDIGLVRKQGGQFIPTEDKIRIGRDSHQLIKHHTNWRIKAIESLDRERLTDMHYSAVISLSESDVVRIKNLLLDQLKENLEIVAASKEERLFGFNIDFYDLESN